MSLLLFVIIDYLIYHRPLLHHLRPAKHSRTDGHIYNLGKCNYKKGPPEYSCHTAIHLGYLYLWSTPSEIWKKLGLAK